MRGAAGCGSTTNSVVTNLGADALLAYHQLTQPGAMTRLAEANVSGEEFLEARARLAETEAPAIRQRSMIRNLQSRLAKLRDCWLRDSRPDG